MTEVVNIHFAASANFSPLIAQINAANAAIAAFNKNAGASGKAATAAAAMGNFNTAATQMGKFHQVTVGVRSEAEKFGQAMSQKRLGLNESYRAMRTIRQEQGVITQLARQQVALQNSAVTYMGRNSAGQAQALVTTAKGVDTFAQSAQLAATKAMLARATMAQFSTGVVNLGKNIQWAGRQMMVGMTIPIGILAGAATAAFVSMDKELTRIQKVYGSGLTFGEDFKKQSQMIREESIALARDLAGSMGQSSQDTLGLTADLAATGLEGKKLMDTVRETSRLALLGETSREDAMKTTLSLQTAFKMNTKELSESVNFMNAVENQTSLSLQDLTAAIPRAGATVKNLGGGIQELSLFMTAFKEGGISAGEGAMALKSGLASIIAPSKDAIEYLKTLGIDIVGIAKKNVGQLVPTILELQGQLEGLGTIEKTNALEKLFGKFQMNRWGAFFNNINKSGSQTIKVLDLMGTRAEILGQVAQQEQTAVTESAANKFKQVMETLKTNMAIMGEDFVGAFTAAFKVIAGIVDKFNKLPKGLKVILEIGMAFAALAPVGVMVGGILLNFLGTLMKIGMLFRSGFKSNIAKILTPELVAAESITEKLKVGFMSVTEQVQILTGAVGALTTGLTGVRGAAGAMTAAAVPMPGKGKENAERRGLILGENKQGAASYTAAQLAGHNTQQLAGIGTTMRLIQAADSGAVIGDVKVREKLARIGNLAAQGTVTAQEQARKEILGFASSMRSNSQFSKIFQEELAAATSSTERYVAGLLGQSYRLGSANVTGGTRPMIAGANLVAGQLAGGVHQPIVGAQGQSMAMNSFLNNQEGHLVPVAIGEKNAGAGGSQFQGTREHLVAQNVIKSINRTVNNEGLTGQAAVARAAALLQAHFTSLGVSAEMLQVALENAGVAGINARVAQEQQRKKNERYVSPETQRAIDERNRMGATIREARNTVQEARAGILAEGKSSAQIQKSFMQQLQKSLGLGSGTLKGVDSSGRSLAAMSRDDLKKAIAAQLPARGKEDFRNQTQINKAISDATAKTNQILGTNFKDFAALSKSVNGSIEAITVWQEKLLASSQVLQGKTGKDSPMPALNKAVEDARVADRKTEALMKTRAESAGLLNKQLNALDFSKAFAKGGGVVQMTGGLSRLTQGIMTLGSAARDVAAKVKSAAITMGTAVKNNLGKTGMAMMGLSMIPMFMGGTEGTSGKAVAANTLSMAGMGASAGMMLGMPFGGVGGGVGALIGGVAGGTFGFIQKMGEAAKEAGQKLVELSKNIAAANERLSAEIVKTLGGTPKIASNIGINTESIGVDPNYSPKMEALIKEKAPERVKALQGMADAEALMAVERMYRELLNQGVTERVALSFVKNLAAAAGKHSVAMQVDLKVSANSIQKGYDDAQKAIDKALRSQEVATRAWGAKVPKTAQEASGWFNPNDYLSDGELSQKTKEIVDASGTQMGTALAEALVAAVEAKLLDKKDFLQEFTKQSLYGINKQISDLGRDAPTKSPGWFTNNSILGPRETLTPGAKVGSNPNFQERSYGLRPGDTATPEAMTAGYLSMTNQQRGDILASQTDKFKEWAKTAEESSDRVAAAMVDKLAPQEQAAVKQISDTLEQGKYGLTKYQATVVALAATMEGPAKKAMDDATAAMGKSGNAADELNGRIARSSGAQRVALMGLRSVYEQSKAEIEDYNKTAAAGQRVDVDSASVALATSRVEGLGIEIDDLKGKSVIQIQAIVTERRTIKEVTQRASKGRAAFGTQEEIDAQNGKQAATDAAAADNAAADAAQKESEARLNEMQKAQEANQKATADAFDKAQKARQTEIDNTKKFYDDQIAAITKAEEVRKKAFEEEQKRRDREKTWSQLQVNAAEAVASGDYFGLVSAQMQMDQNKQQWGAEDQNAAATDTATQQTDALAATRDKKVGDMEAALKAKQEQDALFLEQQKAHDTAVLESARASDQARIESMRQAASEAQAAAAASNAATGTMLFTEEQFAARYNDLTNNKHMTHKQAIEAMAAEFNTTAGTIQNAWVSWANDTLGIPADLTKKMADGLQVNAQMLQLFQQIVQAVADKQPIDGLLAQLTALAESGNKTASSVGSTVAGVVAGTVSIGSDAAGGNSRGGKPDTGGYHAFGGLITGPGTGTSDSIPAYVSNGEYVVRAAAVGKYGKAFLDNINAKRFADGGIVGPGAPAQAPGIVIPGPGLATGQAEQALGEVTQTLSTERVAGDQAAMQSDAQLAQQKLAGTQAQFAADSLNSAALAGQKTLEQNNMFALQSTQIAQLLAQTVAAETQMQSLIIYRKQLQIQAFSEINASSMSMLAAMTLGWDTWSTQAVADIKAVATEFVNSFTNINYSGILDMVTAYATGDTTGGDKAKATLVAAATGGYISGPGTGTSDSIPARLSNGEYVIKQSSVARYGTGFLNKVNQGTLSPSEAIHNFAEGGLVGQMAIKTSELMNKGAEAAIQKAIDDKAATLAPVGTGGTENLTPEQRAAMILQSQKDLGPTHAVIYADSVTNGTMYNGGLGAHHVGWAGEPFWGVNDIGGGGQEVFAYAAGNVIHAGPYENGSYSPGSTVELQHLNGGMTRYAHLQQVLVAVGEAVQAGKLIGISGSDHLHFEWKYMPSLVQHESGGPMPWQAAEGGFVGIGQGGFNSGSLQSLLDSKQIGANPEAWKFQTRTPKASAGVNGFNGIVPTGQAAADLWRWLIGQGLSEAGAAGVMGNLNQESTLDPSLEESGGTGIGLVQWSFGRADALRNFAQSKGKPWQDLNTQLEFLLSEINSDSTWSSMWQQLKTIQDVDAATALFHDTFEKSADRERGIYNERPADAHNFYNNFAKKAAGGYADGGIVGGISDPLNVQASKYFQVELNKFNAKREIVLAAQAAADTATKKASTGANTAGSTPLMEQYAQLMESYLGRSDIDGSSVAGHCLKNVNDLWEKLGQPVTRHPAAVDAGAAVQGANAMQQGDAPRGALVWWNSAVGSGYGHVAVADGKGNFVNNWGSGTIESNPMSAAPNGYIGWSTPDAQKYAAGGLVIPALRSGATINYDNTLANLHKGEAVLTEPLTRKLNEGIDNLATSANTNYNVNVNIDKANATPLEIEQAVYNALEKKEVRSGRARVVGGRR